MRTVELQVLLREVTAEYGDFRLAAPKQAPEEWLAVWDGRAPPEGLEHSAIAGMGLIGDLDGHPAYAERLPVGIRLCDASPPRALAPYISAAVLEAIDALQKGQQAHGLISPRCVFLGVGGEVLLFGRGRGRTLRTFDLLAAATLLPSGADETLPGDSAEAAAARMRQRTSPADRERLSAWVRAQRLRGDRVVEHVAFRAYRRRDDFADEVVPDLGPDGGEGLLERWSVTTSGRTGERTAEVTASPSPPVQSWSAAIAEDAASNVDAERKPDERTITQVAPRIIGPARPWRGTAFRWLELGCAMIVGSVITLAAIALLRGI